VRKDTVKNLTGKPSPFVAFVRELQACVPEEYRRSQPYSAEAPANIALSEGIYRARPFDGLGLGLAVLGRLVGDRAG
jgi:hypothetical protein